ncbi:unnamed protein product [Effrenium voratum]|uniref:Uncharacterized protein n=1 Tax=Effrenium voratum TaxID=2562239 RepID=A0AA36N643_9DINO|nr:unnamed protein product [Effrenium voratum]
MQGPAGGGAGAAPASAPGVREMMRMNIVRVLQFSLGDHRVAGRFHLVYEAEGREGMEARARPDILCIEVELSVEEGKFKPLATAKRMAQEGRLGPWSCTERREVERRWVEMRAKALGVLGLSLELSQFMRLMAGLLGAALLEEPVPNRRLWNALKPLIAGPSPMARLRIGLGGMGVTTFHDLERDAGAAGAAPGAALGAAGPSGPSNDRGTAPLGPGELLSHPPFAEYVCFGRLSMGRELLRNPGGFYPVELVKSRLQASVCSHASSSYRYAGLLDGLVCILRADGLQGLFVGIRPVIVRACTSDFVAVYAGEALLQRLGSPGAGFLEGFFWRTVGCAASVASTSPLETVAARVTTSFPPLTTRMATRALWSEGGLQAFWRGLRVNLVLCLNPGLTFTALAQIKRLILSLRRRQQMSVLEAALAGVLAKFLALLLSYPLMRGKSLVQARDTGSGVSKVLQDVVAHEGMLSLYQGFGAQLSKSLLSAAVKYSLKDHLEEMFRRGADPCDEDEAKRCRERHWQKGEMLQPA